MKFKSQLKNNLHLIDLTPIVDVIFLLLIFFIITSDLLPLKSLNIDNPKLHRESVPLTTQILLIMDAHHVIYLGSKKEIIDLTILKKLLKEKINQQKYQHPGSDPTIVLSIDKNVSYDAFLKLFSIVQQCGQRVRLVYKTSNDSN